MLFSTAPPSSVTVSGLPAALSVGERYRAWCSAPQSRPPPILIWRLTRAGKPPTVLARQVR